VMQYGHKGPVRHNIPAGCSLEPVTATRRHRISLGNSHQCGGHTALLREGHTPPSVMPIYSPHESASGGNENSPGDSLVRSLEGLPYGCHHHPTEPLAHDSGILLALACLPFLPTRLPAHPGPACLSLSLTDWGPGFSRKNQGSFGCSVNLPLGSRSVDPHSTAVWCGNLLHSSPQSHTAELCFATPRSVEYSLLQPRSALNDARAGSTPSGISSHSCPFYTMMLCLGCHIVGRP